MPCWVFSASVIVNIWLNIEASSAHSRCSSRRSDHDVSNSGKLISETLSDITRDLGLTVARRSTPMICRLGCSSYRRTSFVSLGADISDRFERWPCKARVSRTGKVIMPLAVNANCVFQIASETSFGNAKGGISRLFRTLRAPGGGRGCL